MSTEPQDIGLQSIARDEHARPSGVPGKRVFPYGWDGVNPQPLRTDGSGRLMSGGGGSTGTVTSVNDSATSQTLLAANPSAVERIISNDSPAILYIKFGATASATDYTLRLQQYDTITTGYTGVIDGIWASDSTGAAKVTEIT